MPMRLWVDLPAVARDVSEGKAEACATRAAVVSREMLLENILMELSEI